MGDGQAPLLVRLDHGDAGLVVGVRLHVPGEAAQAAGMLRRRCIPSATDHGVRIPVRAHGEVEVALLEHHDDGQRVVPVDRQLREVSVHAPAP